jgi:hypothetical protein
MEIRVISGDKDGADLRREKRKASYYERCSGKADNEQIQGALDRAPQGSKFYISGSDYDRIFGGTL